ncbi:MAG: hypothetical protein WAT66_10835 [Actinomycetota bacterium]
MIDRDLVETLIALALILACALTVIASAQSREERPPRAKREKRPSRDPVATTEVGTESAAVTTALAAPAASETIPAPATGRPRPRFLTGEPAALEPSRPATRRAIAFIGGITALAAGGAVGLLVLVRALVAMFKRIGG